MVINKKLSAGKITAGKLILFVLAGIIAIPVVGMASFSISCQAKMAGIDKQSSEIREKLERLSISTSDRTATADGDCLTGSGTSFSFNALKEYASPLEAKNNILQSLTAVGIPTPTLSQVPQYISASEGSISGGGTPIKDIELVYQVNDSDSFRFKFSLDQPIPCAVTQDEKVECGGEDKDVMLNTLIASHPISLTNVSGSVRVK